MRFLTFNLFLLASTFAASSAPVTFSNPSPITINDSATPPTLATPYGSSIVVSGLNGSMVTKITVQLNGFGHQFPDDMDLLLVGPQGQKAFIMCNVGGSTPGYAVTNLTITLDDDAADPLPLEAALVSGTFKPTKRLASLLFDLPPPAPAGNSNSVATLSVFKGVDPNGTWSLFAVDDTNPDSGTISGGWSISIITTPVLLSIVHAGNNVVLSWTNAATGFTLETTPSLSSPAVWTNAIPDAIEVSGRFTVTNAISGTRRFYRLIK
jgi:hypothetical protein